MAQLVATNIHIQGKKIHQFSSLTISQGICKHHRFRIVCPAESIDGTSGILRSSKNMVGSRITIEINSIGNPGGLQFAGVVTQVETEHYSGHAGDIIISGYSPTIILDNGPHCKSWEKQSVKNITHDVLKHFPANLFKRAISPLNGECLSYTVQYNETAWQFLNRFSSTYGEWFYYDGEQLVLGPPKGNKVNLFFGCNLERFNMALQIRPAKFQTIGHNFIDDEVHTASPSGIVAKGGLNELAIHAYNKSEQFYGAQPKHWDYQLLTNQEELDELVNIRAAMQSSNLVRFNGGGSHPGLQVGGTVTVQGRNIFNHSNESFGDYTVITVNHCCDGQGNYTNTFEAIPSTIKVPPIQISKEPRCETQSALVTDNYDEEGLGRVRVKFHWMNGVEKTPWIRITSPHGGGNKGMFFIPEIGEEVIVGFESDSPVKPYVIGTVYNGKAKTEFSNKDNDVKALQTRSGNKIIMNDKDGSIVIADPSGNVVTMHGNGELTIHAPKVLKLVSTDIYINAENSINLGVGHKENPDTANIVLLKEGKVIELHAKDTITGIADNNLNLEGKKAFNAVAGKLTIDGGSKATISSQDTDIF